MDEKDINLLRHLVDEGKDWKQDIFIRDDSGKQLNIGCAIDSNVPAKTPPDATNQPLHYPRGSVYRFPTSFKGRESFSSLLSTLQMPTTCPGAKMLVQRSDNKCTDASNTLGRWTVGCNKWRSQAETTDSGFDPGKMALSGIKEETVLTQKTKFIKAPGVKAMYSKSIKKNLPPAKKPKSFDNKLSITRKLSSRAESKKTRCRMSITIRLGQDCYFYLSKCGNICHNDHLFQAVSASSRSSKEFNDEDRNLLEIMYDNRVKPAQMARIMTDMKGKNSGVFLPKTIYDMNAKTKKMLNLAKGIEPKMSDAEKTLKKLET